jgi:hypothetical protein
MRKIVFLFLLVGLFSNCRKSYDNVIPASAGSPGHILLIMDAKHWIAKQGDTLRAIFNQEYTILPQSEPIFDVSHINHNAFSGKYKRTKNIIISEISINVDKPGIFVSHDLYASPQVIVSVRAKTDKQFIEILGNNSKAIINTFENAEKDRLIKIFTGKHLNKKIQSTLSEKHFFTLSIPSEFQLDVDSPNFVWISKETQNISQGILIWDYPFSNIHELSLDSLINKRDEITKNKVSGPIEGSYMTTEKLISPARSELLLNKVEAVKIRGLWKVDGVQGVFMGGPFVSYTIIDKKRNRIITADAYVYGIESKKRELTRQVDAIISTLRIIE